MWAQMVIAAALDGGSRPGRKPWGLHTDTAHHLPQSPSRLPLPFSAAPEPVAHLLLSDTHSRQAPEFSWFPTPGHLPINAKPRPAGSKNDFFKA